MSDDYSLESLRESRKKWEEQKRLGFPTLNIEDKMKCKRLFDDIRDQTTD